MHSIASCICICSFMWTGLGCNSCSSLFLICLLNHKVPRSGIYLSLLLQTLWVGEKLVLFHLPDWKGYEFKPILSLNWLFIYGILPCRFVLADGWDFSLLSALPFFRVKALSKCKMLQLILKWESTGFKKTL